MKTSTMMTMVRRSHMSVLLALLYPIVVDSTLKPGGASSSSCLWLSFLWWWWWWWNCSPEGNGSLARTALWLPGCVRINSIGLCHIWCICILYIVLLIRGFSSPDEERSVDPAGKKIFRCIARDRTVVPGRQHDEGDLGDDEHHDGLWQWWWWWWWWPWWWWWW